MLSVSLMTFGLHVYAFILGRVDLVVLKNCKPKIIRLKAKTMLKTQRTQNEIEIHLISSGGRSARTISVCHLPDWQKPSTAFF